MKEIRVVKIGRYSAVMTSKIFGFAESKKMNYAKFQGVEAVQEDKKALKIDFLAKIKKKE